MADTSAFERDIIQTAEKIMQSIPTEGELTSWELKTKLHLSSSMLYLALGFLLNQGKIKLSPDQLNYRVAAVAPVTVGNGS